MSFLKQCRCKPPNSTASLEINRSGLLAFAVSVAAILQIAVQPVVGQELGTSDAGYIDGAILRNQLRFRFDAAFDNPFPDRAEFFYARCGCFTNGNGPGPPLAETGVDYQEVAAYLEYMLTTEVSTFVEVPLRFIDPEANANRTGLGDVRAGLKYALVNDADRWLTFQMRGYFPTGDGRQGLGTEHFSLEPGLLYQRNFDGLSVFGDFKVWIPFDTSTQSTMTNTDSDPALESLAVDYSGTIAQYGLGFSYDLFRDTNVIRGQNSRYPQDSRYPTGQSGYPLQSNRYSLQPGYSSYRQSPAAYIPNGYQAPTTQNTWHESEVFVEQDRHSLSQSSRLAAVVEVVGWTVGGGLKLSPEGTLLDATNDTIANLKLGLRWNTSRTTVYVGYGRALTGDIWYQDFVRAEYGLRF